MLVRADFGLEEVVAHLVGNGIVPAGTAEKATRKSSRPRSASNAARSAAATERVLSMLVGGVGGVVYLSLC